MDDFLSKPGRASLLVSAALLFSSQVALTQFVQQGPKLVGSGAVGDAHQGHAVALSADGNTAILGGPDDDNEAGAAWVFTRSDSIWTQQGSKLVGTAGVTADKVGGALRGQSVALSADGNTAIVGGPYDNGYTGAAWVFTRSGDVWTQQGDKLVGSGAVGGAKQGHSVALSADGNTAIVGGPGDNEGRIGAAWVFTRSGGVWTQQGDKLVGSGAVSSLMTPGLVAGSTITVNQGQSVALSADGNTAIVGAPSDDHGVGAAWVFTRSGVVWTQQGDKLVGSRAAFGRQGQSVALSADGNTAIVGGPYDNSYAGAAWVFTRSGGVWTQQGSKLVGTGAVGGALQGQSVALSADGNTAIVGGPRDSPVGRPSYAGAAWLFARSGGVWTQQGNKLVGTGAVAGASQGSSVALSADASTAIVGGPIETGHSGAAWVFSRSRR